MPVTITAFQPNAFQNNAFQIAVGGGPTGIPGIDLGNLDRGIVYQAIMAYLGPTLGWVKAFVLPMRETGVSGLILPADNAVLCTAGGITLILPDVALWVKEPHYQPYAPFDRSLWIKDISGSAGVSPITVTPFAGQFIDFLSSFQIISNRGILRLYPLQDLTGWFSG